MKSVIKYLTRQIDILAALLLMGLAFWLNPYLDSQQNNADEGINLAKTMLFSAGYDLYSEVWNDQPPLMTYMLSSLWGISGQSFESGKILVFLLATVLCCVTCRLTRIAWDRQAAIICGLLLFTFPQFLFFASSLLIGIPAITFLTVSILLLIYWKSDNRIALVLLSGFFYALAILTKLFCLAALPVIFMIFIGRTAGKISLKLAPLIVWISSSLIFATLIFLPFYSEEALSQLLSPHFTARTSLNYVNTKHLFQYYCLLALSLIGAGLALRQKSHTTIFIALWFAVTALAISTHRPLWSHHFLLPAIPAVILSAGAISKTADFLSGQRKKLAFASSLLLAASYIYYSGSYNALKPFLSEKAASDLESEKLINYLKEKRKDEDFILTDMPVYAFKSGLLPLPETAVFSAKRLETGNLTENQLLDLIKGRKPEFILFKRFSFERLTHEIEKLYTLQKIDSFNLYIKKCDNTHSCLLSDPSWFRSEEARIDADMILDLQNPDGGWLKNFLFSIPDFRKNKSEFQLRSTIDNNATSSEIRFLARMYKFNKLDKYYHSIDRGIRFLIDNQHKTGGWKQTYRADGLEDPNIQLAFNDDAIVNVLELFSDIKDKEDFAAFRQKYEVPIDLALKNATDFIIKTQVIQNGHKTAWCAQYNADSLLPEKARSYEPASISGHESVEIVRFLMKIPNPSQELTDSIESAVRWFKNSAISGYRLRQNLSRKSFKIIKDRDSRVWARFYDLQSNQPVFQDRDGTIYSDYSQLSTERAHYYNYFSIRAEELLSKDY